MFLQSLSPGIPKIYPKAMFYMYDAFQYKIYDIERGFQIE